MSETNQAADAGEQEGADEAEAAPAKRRRVDLPKPSRIDRWGMNPADRARVMEACHLLQRSGWKTHFATMMLMSVIVAIMGLSANSAALVIGAMLIAPLMTPVLGVAASVAMALGPALIRTATTVFIATVGAIFLGYLGGKVVPNELSSEVLARTAPDLRDLIVALAAGVAGAYATARPDVSSSLPGVAIAVALVPPLAAVGLTLEAGRGDLASGALLLYLTNLAAIIFASTAIFLVTGFVPARRFADTRPRVIAGALVALAVLVFISIRLGITSVNSAESANERRDVEAAVADWLEGTNLDIEEVDINGDRVTVELEGLDQPPPTEGLRLQLSEVLGPESDVDVLWTQAQRRDDTEAEPSEAELVTAEVRQIVEQWLAADGEGNEYDVTRLEVADDILRVDIASAVPPPSVEALQARILDVRGTSPEVRINWTQRTRIEADENAATIDETTARLRSAAQDWAIDRDIIVERVRFDGEVVEVDLIGPQMPDAEELKATLAEISAGQVQVFFTQRVPVEAPTPTPTPEPTPTPDPTPTPEPTPTATPEPQPDNADSDGSDTGGDPGEANGEADTDDPEADDAAN